MNNNTYPPAQPPAGPPTYPAPSGPNYGHHYPGPPSPGYTPPHRGKNKVGTVALILAIIGTLIACAPYVFVLGWPVLLAAFVVSIVGLTRPNKRKGTSIAGLIISVVGSFLAIFASMFWLLVATDQAVRDVMQNADAPAIHAAYEPPTDAFHLP